MSVGSDASKAGLRHRLVGDTFTAAREAAAEAAVERLRGRFAVEYPRLWNRDVLWRLYTIEKRPCREIAELFGCSPALVTHVLKKLGIPLRPRGAQLPAETRARLRDRVWLAERLELLTCDEIGELLQVSGATVSRWAGLHGIALPPLRESTRERQRASARRRLPVSAETIERRRRTNQARFERKREERAERLEELKRNGGRTFNTIDLDRRLRDREQLARGR